MPDTPEAIKRLRCIGIVGAGNMGSMMAFAFAELGLDVSVWDVKKENINNSLDSHIHRAKGMKEKIRGFTSLEEFMESLEKDGARKLFIFSVTHGNPADSVLQKMKRHLKKGDTILDGGNEHYRNTERRQKECDEIGVSWIGMGVSGGYQAARHGPSLSPGGDPKALEAVLPILELYAAKDPKTGKPCVANIGPGGSGHYVKMVHNGIEGGMLSALCEAWSFMHTGLGLDYNQIGDIFTKWNESGGLRGNYLVQIGADICKTKKASDGNQRQEGHGKDASYVLDDVLDKVVQDDDNTEGTLMWSLMESAVRHVSCPTLATGHYLRIASGNREERLEVAQKLSVPKPKPVTAVQDRAIVIENLRRAVYCAFLASFCQGLELISRASKDEGWNIDLGVCIQIWRAGCIIRSEYIADLVQPELTENKQLSNMKFINQVAEEFQQNYPALKEIVIEGTRSDLHLPAISSTLEYLKYVSGSMLPTQFMEAEMDYFGAHSYNLPGVRGEDPGPVAKGPHHYEWKPA